MTHLKSRSEAIRAAIKTYNDAAKQAKRPILNPDDVLQYSYIGQFDVLKDTRNAVTEKPWAVPANRIARDAWYRSERAKEEIIRAEVEVARLRSWVEKEEALFSERIKSVADGDINLADEMSRRLSHLKQAHARIYQDLDRIHTIPGYRPNFTYNSTSPQLAVAFTTGVEDPEAESDNEEAAQQALDDLLNGVAHAESLG